MHRAMTQADRLYNPIIQLQENAARTQVEEATDNGSHT